MADLAQRNAALEERAAASILRAKAVVEGSDAAALKAQITTSTGGSAGFTESISATAERLASDAACAAYDAPPTPPQEPVAQPVRKPSDTQPSSRNSNSTRHTSSSRPSSRSSAPKDDPASSSSDSSVVASHGDDNAGRLARARIRALQDELAAQGRELREAHSRLKDRDLELKSLLQEKLAAAKLTKALQASIEKEKRAAAEARVTADARERECAELRREGERAARGAKAGEQEMRARDVRLNRALEEVERYRHMLEAARDAGKGGDTGARHEAERLAAENKRLERQKQELVAAFKKQMKLIDVLKKQKIHMEAARMLQFAEEEFMKTLDAHN